MTRRKLRYMLILTTACFLTATGITLPAAAWAWLAPATGICSTTSPALLIAPLSALGISPLTTEECTAVPWSEDQEYSMIPPAFSQNGFAGGELEIEIEGIHELTQ